MQFPKLLPVHNVYKFGMPLYLPHVPEWAVQWERSSTATSIAPRPALPVSTCAARKIGCTLFPYCSLLGRIVRQSKIGRAVVDAAFRGRVAVSDDRTVTDFAPEA